MLAASDDVARQAYSRMTLDSEHKWSLHAARESDFIIEHCRLSSGDDVLDFGCGNGRHAIELGRRGMNVVGVDYIQGLLNSGQMHAASAKLGTKVRFVLGDCRTVNLQRKFSAAVCLYDVIGSYGRLGDNVSIINNLRSHLKPDGYLLLSVMNRTVTEKMAVNRFSLRNEPNKILSLPPSRTMENSGNVFDPKYYMIDLDTGCVYRREQFEHGNQLPVELIVRDRRFYAIEIIGLLRSAGFLIEWFRFVQAGRWEVQLSEDDTRAKEILVLCRVSA